MEKDDDAKEKEVGIRMAHYKQWLQNLKGMNHFFQGPSFKVIVWVFSLFIRWDHENTWSWVFFNQSYVWLSCTIASLNGPSCAHRASPFSFPYSGWAIHESDESSPT